MTESSLTSSEKESQLNKESLYKIGLECAATHNLTGTPAADFAKDYVAGFIEGYTDEGIEIAKRLLARNYDVKFAAEATGLTEDVIRKLQSVQLAS